MIVILFPGSRRKAMVPEKRPHDGSPPEKALNGFRGMEELCRAIYRGESQALG